MGRLDPVPPESPLDTELREARRVALEAQQHAEALEAGARQARRRADSARRHYENLLMELTQGTLEFEEGS